MTTNYSWAAQVLSYAGLPVTGVNITNVATWMEAEEPDTDWWHAFDPLNVNNLTEGGKESFPNLDQAALATASVIRQTNMAGIYRTLANSEPLATFSAAVVASPWAASHYGGDPLHLAKIPAPPVILAPGTPAPPPGNIPHPPPSTLEDVQLYATNSAGTGFVIATDLSTKVGIPDAPDAAALQATGQYVAVKLSDSFLDSIPNA